MNFEKELEHLLNRYSQENGSNTPDFILAKYLNDCLTKLYSLEDKMHELAREVIRERIKVLGQKEHDEVPFFQESLPQHLFDYLETWDREAARLAAEAFLEYEFKATVNYKE